MRHKIKVQKKCKKRLQQDPFHSFFYIMLIKTVYFPSPMMDVFFTRRSHNKEEIVCVGSFSLVLFIGIVMFDYGFLHAIHLSQLVLYPNIFRC